MDVRLFVLRVVFCSASLAAIGVGAETFAVDREAADGEAVDGEHVELAGVIFAQDFTEEGKPISIGDAFYPTDTVRLKAVLKGKPTTGIMKCRFFYHGTHITDLEVDLAVLKQREIPEGYNAYVTFNLFSDDGLPISTEYRADIYYNDSKLDSTTFRIKPPKNAIESRVQKAELARGMDSDNKPTELGKRFKVEDEVHLVGVADLGVRTRLRGEWHINGKLDEQTIRIVEADRNANEATFFFAYVPDGGWPKGEHEVVLYVNDERFDSYKFRIE